jgi:glycosyltransferase involved in cell wall biosynthesis
MMPEISVIVPVYNTAEFLEQCLDTIINQTFKNIEIMCVDDGSTDSSLKILQKYAERDARVFVIHRDKASGSAALPRNIGIEHVKGKYLMFLDSDDYFDLMMLQKMYTCQKKRRL